MPDLAGFDRTPPPPDRVVYRHSYVDPLGRPMTGTVTVTAMRRMHDSGEVIPAEASAPVILDENGQLEVELKPGYYRLTAKLRTAHGQDVTDEVTITAAL